MNDTKTLCKTLANGLTVLLHETHRAPVATLQVWAQVGSADETSDEAGLAHFHEHMLFKGTARRGVGEIAGTIEGLGGQMNAYTSFDETVYYATLPSHEIETGIDLLADAIQNSCFDATEIAREIEVVLEEIRRAEDSPDQVFHSAMFAACYTAHPYRLPILGTPESVESFSREKILRFFERWYAPNNLLFLAVGDFDSNVVLALIERAFASAKPAASRRSRTPEPAQTEPRSFVLRRPFERTSLDLAYASLSFAHPDTPHLDLLSYCLGSGDSSRLAQRVKDAEQLVDQIDAYSYTPLDRGLVSCSADLDPERVLEAVQAIAREVAELSARPIARDELEKARSNFLAHETFARESVESLARKLGHFQFFAGDYRNEAKYLEAVRAATADDLLRVARTYLKPNQLTVGVLLPESAELQLAPQDVLHAATRGVEKTARRFAPPARGNHLPKSKIPSADRHKEESPIHAYALENGAQLFVLPRPGVASISARAAFFGGLLAEATACDAGLSGLVSSLWTRGTARLSAASFARDVESLAASIDGFTGRNSFGLTLDVTTDHFLPALDLFSEALLTPNFDEAEIEREKEEVLAAIERREDELAQLAYLALFREQYGEHPYAHAIRGEKETVTAFDAERVAQHHSRWICANNLVLAIAGDVDPDTAAREIAARFSELPTQTFTRPQYPLAALAPGIREIEIKKNRAQMHLVVGFRGVTVHDEHRYALDVASQILAGQGGRLFLELRDRQSLAYSVSASNVEGLDPGFFAIYIATAPEKTQQAERGIFMELEKLRTTEPSDEEFLRAKNYLIGNFLIAEQRNTTHAAHMALDALYGLGADASMRYREKIAALSKQDVLRAVRQVLTLDRCTIVRVGA